MKTTSYARLFVTFCVISSAMLPFTDSTFSQTTACNYYASPTGTGNGWSQSSPFKISNFWAVAGPGETLCLLDGTYRGDSSMINPPSALNGSAGQPITVKCLNEVIDSTKGSTPCLIDGELARNPI